MSRVVVVGSLNIDTSLSVARLPRRGETVTTRGLARGLGGKGANQAIAAARAGAEVLMVATTGPGAPALEGVDCSGIVTVDVPTGSATILVEEGTGENIVLVDPGANAHLEQALTGLVLRPGDVLVCQLEARPDLMPGLLEAAGVTTVVNAAPMGPHGAAAARVADHVIVNEVEMEELDRESGWRTGQTLVLTLGERGVVVVTPDGATEISAPRVRAVDTTGAGDCFVGTYAAGLARHGEPVRAARDAVQAASRSTTRPGASASF